MSGLTEPPAPTSEEHPVTDPRGPRFAAAVTTLVLAAALLTGSRWVLAFQVAVFGLTWATPLSPYGLLYRHLVRPRLGPPAELEDTRPLRFAQLVGLLVIGPGLVLALAGVPWAVETGAGLALVAAFLNAAFGLCLGCELYLLGRRLRPAATPSGSSSITFTNRATSSRGRR